MLTQPTEIPGQFEETEQPFPPSDRVMSRRWQGFAGTGIFCYVQDYRELRASFKDVGWTYARTAGQVLPGDVSNFAEDGVTASYHAPGGKPRSEFPSDAAFIDSALHKTFAFLERYPDTEYIHVWNEPNYHYLLGTIAVDPAAQEAKAQLYGKLLLAVGALVRERWPKVKILGFDLGGAGPNGTDFMRRVYGLHGEKAHRAYDILALHPGVHNVPPETDYVGAHEPYSISRCVAIAREIWRPLGIGGKKVWFTEFGWKISKEEGGTYPQKPGTTVSRWLQAAYFCRYYALAGRLGVDRVAPFYITDVKDAQGGLNSGFFDEGGGWRPSAHAVANMIQLMPRPLLAEIVSDGEAGTYAWTFQPDALELSQRHVTMAWAIQGPDKLELPAGDYRVTDMLGGTSQSAGVFDIGPLPVYIQRV